MTPEELRQRTKTFGVDALRFCRTIPNDVGSRHCAKQFVRCATSVGANYRSASYAKSTADMISKLKIVEEEADESQYWLGLLVESDSVPRAKAEPLLDEGLQLFKIAVASIKTLRKKGQ